MERLGYSVSHMTRYGRLIPREYTAIIRRGGKIMRIYGHPEAITNMARETQNG